MIPSTFRAVPTSLGKSLPILFSSSLSVSSSNALSSSPSLSHSFSSSASASSPPLLKTTLYDRHVSLGGKMVGFAGYSLPVQYTDSLVQSHLHCRSQSSLFDVSHMGQVIITGEHRVKFMETVTVGDFQSLQMNQSRLSLILNDQGYIIDDCMATKKSDHIYLVINAGCKEKDWDHLRTQLKIFNSSHPSASPVVLSDLSNDNDLIALQGPQSSAALTTLIPENISLDKLPFLFSANLDVLGVPCLVSRCGYTGEDGFEISVPKGKITKVWDAILDTKLTKINVKAAALGVRDSLRLEAGLCLYGHDINDTITPIEASLSWVITKRRQKEGGFIGDKKVMEQINNPSLVTKKRVGFTLLDKAPAREGTKIHSAVTDEEIGIVTSGSFSPCLNIPISMGYVQTKDAKIGTSVLMKIRGKSFAAKVTKMPFVPTKYFQPK